MDVEELLKEMSLQEKIFQLEQFNSVLLKPLEGWDATGPMKDLGVTERDLKDTGSLLNSMGVKRMKDIQKDFLAKNENKIPLAFMHDVIHGYRTIYPINLGLACSFVRPVKELKGFEKIELDVGESKKITFMITEEMIAFYGAGMRRIAEKGAFRVFIGKNSDVETYQEFELL